MIIQHTYRGIDYILSNEDLKEGAKVYPISNGRVCENTVYIHYEYDFKIYSSGFPDEPHTILEMNYRNGENKPYEVRTDYGFGPKETYYKIIASLNKADYIVIRQKKRTNKHTYLYVLDKISRSTHIAIGPRKMHLGFTLINFLTKEELKVLKEFRTAELKPLPRFTNEEYSLIDVLNNIDMKIE